MNLFSKTKQRITISGEVQSTLEALASEIGAKKLKDTKISSVKHAGHQWQCVISCNRAEVIYYKEILPLLYGSVETQALQVALEFNDENELARHCPLEVMASFSLSSRHAFGNKAEQEFLYKLHKEISQRPGNDLAVVSYYIVSGASVTISVPCKDTEAMMQYLKDKFISSKIKDYMINIIDRRTGAVHAT